MQRLSLVLKPTVFKLLLTTLTFFLFYLLVTFCAPLEYEWLGVDIGGREINYQCGVVSNLLGQIFGSAWINPSPLSYWPVYLLLSYLLSSVLIFLKRNKF